MGEIVSAVAMVALLFLCVTVWCAARVKLPASAIVQKYLSCWSSIGPAYPSYPNYILEV